jgi:hypothetical protein
VLDVTPNDVLLPDERHPPDDHDRWLSRLIATARMLETDDLRLAVRQIEALVEHRTRAARGDGGGADQGSSGIGPPRFSYTRNFFHRSSVKLKYTSHWNPSR